VLSQTVPDRAKTEPVKEMELYLAAMIRQVDSSLLEEWEKMRDPNYQAVERAESKPPGAEEALRDITRDTRNFTAAIRTRIFNFLRALVNAEYEAALENLDSIKDGDGSEWTSPKLEAAMENYYAEHDRIRLDPEARNTRNTYVIPAEDKRSWTVQQMLIDPEEANDWMAEFLVDLAASREKALPVIALKAIRRV
jgi:hypothetical protein